MPEKIAWLSMTFRNILKTGCGTHSMPEAKSGQIFVPLQQSQSNICPP